MSRLWAEIPQALPRGSEPAGTDELLRLARERLGHPPRGNEPSSEWFRELADERPFREGTPAREGLFRLARGEAVSVTTGQQPALLGGPFLVLLKAATAIEVSRRLSSRGMPAVPVFWNAADDTDFPEAARAWWAREDLSLELVALGAEGRPPRQMVGSLAGGEVREETRRLIEGARGEPAGRHLVDWAGALWDQAGGEARDLGELFSLWLARVFREEGLVVVDARSATLRRHARPLIERYLSCWRELGESLGGHQARVVSPREGPELAAGALSWCLFRADGNTRSPLPTGAPEKEARTLLAMDPPGLSPNVVLRPVMEDYLFPHVARVVGPTEMRYHEELAPAYSLLGVRRPRPIARLSLTLVPPEGVELTRRSGERPENLWVDYDGVVTRAALAGSKGAGADALARLRSRWEGGLEDLRRALMKEGRDLGAHLDRSAGKVDYELGRLEEGFARDRRRTLLSSRPRLRQLKDYLFPRGRPQERFLSSTSLLSTWGEVAPELLCRLAGHHLDRWGEGEWSHLVVSQEREGNPGEGVA